MFLRIFINPESCRWINYRNHALRHVLRNFLCHYMCVRDMRDRVWYNNNSNRKLSRILSVFYRQRENQETKMFNLRASLDSRNINSVAIPQIHCSFFLCRACLLRNPPIRSEIQRAVVCPVDIWESYAYSKTRRWYRVCNTMVVTFQGKGGSMTLNAKVHVSRSIRKPNARLAAASDPGEEIGKNN